MIIVNRIGDQISGSVNGQPFSVSFDEKKYEAMLELQAQSEKVDTMDALKDILDQFTPLTQESYKELVETVSPYIMVKKSTNKFYLQYNGEVSSKALPQGLADKIIKSVEKGIDITPLIKFWARWLRNPYYTDAKSKLLFEYIEAPYTNETKVAELMKDNGLSTEVAKKAATTPQVAITREGLMAVYKVSRELKDKFKLNDKEEAERISRFGKDIDPDTGLVTYKKAAFNEDRVFEPAVMGQGGDAFFCGEAKGHILKIGQVIKLESWDQVDTSDARTGVKGLHCGGLRYIAGWQGGDTETHLIFVDPMHIGAIVGLGNGNDGAIRVKQLFVYGAFTGVNKQIYHSSRYAEISDLEYAALVEEAVKATTEKAEKLKGEAKERAALAKI